MGTKEIVATVVSIVPHEIKSDMPTVHPGDFVIPASDGKTPVVLVVKEAGHDVYMGSDRTPHSMRVKIPAYDVARAIVEQYLHSVIATADNAQPGIFWVPGEYDADMIELSFPKEMQNARIQQKNWYLELVKMADDDWTKSNHRHSAISNLQRMAADFLGFKREWVDAVKTNPELLNLVPCPACTTVISRAALLCPNCKTILKPEEYKKYQLVEV